ncbi:MAG: hypothetical protein H6862_01025 [Rhodospirillales bacterium]|nr:hypothetical protein [Rhodospirillales bacterium]
METVYEEPAQQTTGESAVSEAVLPAPSKDVQGYLENLDLGVLFNFLGGPMMGMRIVSMRPVFQEKATDTDIETLERNLGALPETSPFFFADHMREFMNSALAASKARKEAKERRQPFKEPPQPFARNYCRMAFARHVSVCGKALTDSLGGGESKMALSILTPDAPTPSSRSTHILHTDMNGYRLALDITPA